MRHILHYHIHDVEPYINWLYFFHAWDIPQSEREGLLKDAKALLCEMDGSCLTHAIVGIYEAWSEGDDIVVADTVRLPMLRQQQGETCLCLSDF
ncbi:MAG: 5-methyltetrahydrofolate--homocysteine methyltransferase, partial [Prevotellaceae bacterium]|nr:5-methyltetrahydrofolate--homocysteine methyltransferase [Prevotellaceae bacterium]